MANTGSGSGSGSDINPPSEGKDDAVNDGENDVEAQNVDGETENVVEALSDDGVMLLSQTIMDQIVNDAPDDDQELGERLREYGRAVFSELDYVDTVLPPVDDILQNLAEIRKSLILKGISQHTNKCLETMVKVIMTESIDVYRSNEPDCFKGYYVVYFEGLKKLSDEIMNNLVVDATILKKLPDLLNASTNDDMEGLKWSLERLDVAIIELYVILSSYFQMLEKLKAFMKYDKKVRDGTI
ncbi:unnamed protein product [Trifolium pratense]|uniref:Uncharacterized protein n=1 Tax=Trifolium pratense TaxID=57577 RepID=A0ACB0J0S3_TRIPR|nr:unnamed protein product [Trifolium pratense]